LWTTADPVRRRSGRIPGLDQLAAALAVPLEEGVLDDELEELDEADESDEVEDDDEEDDESEVFFDARLSVR
jgi:hypothetical protein